MTLAVGYVRASTATQVDSAAIQEQAIREHCTRQGLTLIRIIVDAATSGTIPLRRRVGGALLTRMCQRGDCEAIVALRLDRLFRGAGDAMERTADWTGAGVALHLLDFGGMSLSTGTAAGRAFIGMLAVFAEFERALTSERTSDAIAWRRSQGMVVSGAPPYGFEHEDGRVNTCTAEQVVCGEVVQMRRDGMTFRAIQTELWDCGIRNRVGGRMSLGTIHGIINREENHAQSS